MNSPGEFDGDENTVSLSSLDCSRNEAMQSTISAPCPNISHGSTALVSGCYQTGENLGNSRRLAIDQSLSDKNGWEILIAAGKIQQASRSFDKLPWRGISMNAYLNANIEMPGGEFDNLPLEEDQYVPPLFDLQARNAVLAELVAVAVRRGWDSLSQSLSQHFPLPSLLDVLVHRFFKQHNRKIDPWIHSPTFRPASTNIELTATIVASSALNTPSISLRRVGSMMLKCLRPMITVKVGFKIRLIRESECLPHILPRLMNQMMHRLSCN